MIVVSDVTELLDENVFGEQPLRYQRNTRGSKEKGGRPQSSIADTQAAKEKNIGTEKSSSTVLLMKCRKNAMPNISSREKQNNNRCLSLDVPTTIASQPVPRPGRTLKEAGRAKKGYQRPANSTKASVRDGGKEIVLEKSRGFGKESYSAVHVERPRIRSTFRLVARCFLRAAVLSSSTGPDRKACLVGSCCLASTCNLARGSSLDGS